MINERERLSRKDVEKRETHTRRSEDRGGTGRHKQADKYTERERRRQTKRQKRQTDKNKQNETEERKKYR